MAVSFPSRAAAPAGSTAHAGVPARLGAGRRRAAAWLGAASLGLGLAVTASPAAAASEIYPAPASGAWEVSGHGFGHGRGLSQWGAQGAALQGVGATEILDFYYPGTGVRDIGNPQVRVLLTAPSNNGTVTFWPRAGAARPAVGTTDGRVLSGAYLSFRAAGGQILAEVRGTRGGAVTDSGTVPAGTTIYTGSGIMLGDGAAPTRGWWYRGEVAIQLTGSTFEVVNRLGMQEYLYGVVPRESPASWAPAALQAQAVAARTYEQAVARPTATNDICDTTQCQVYGGRELVDVAAGRVVQGESASTNAAVDATRGVIRTRSATDARPAFTQFSSSSGGYTVAAGADHPYLRAQPDPWSGTAPRDPATHWTYRLTVDSVSQRCTGGGRATALEITSRDGRGEWGGRITGLTVHCTTGPVSVDTEFARRLGMRSSWWRPAGEPQRTYTSEIFLSDTLGAVADRSFEYGPETGSAIFAGDWNGDGRTGIASRVGNVFSLRQEATAGEPEAEVAYGRAEDVVYIGTWVAGGSDSAAVRRGNVFHLKHILGGGAADRLVAYGRPTDEVFFGDWDGDGIDTPGVRRGNTFHLSNSFAGGVADIEVAYGRAGEPVVMGDWDGNGTDTPAIRRGNTYYVANSFDGGQADRVVPFGRDTDHVLVGDWNGDGIDSLGLHRLS